MRLAVFVCSAALLPGPASKPARPPAAAVLPAVSRQPWSGGSPNLRAGAVLEGNSRTSTLPGQDEQAEVPGQLGQHAAAWRSVELPFPIAMTVVCSLVGSVVGAVALAMRARVQQRRS